MYNENGENMDEVKLIEINISGLTNNIAIVINPLKKLIYSKNLTYKLAEDKLYTFFNIIKLWKGNYYRSNVIDAEEFIIKIYVNDKIDIIKGKGEYPDNYSDFKDWINSLYA